MDETRAEEKDPDLRPADEIRPAPAPRPPGAAAFRHLLACVDSSPESEGALALGLTIAKACAARITLLRTLESGPSRGSLPATDALSWELARAEAMQYLEALRERLARPPIQIELRLEEGHAASRILAVARSTQADLILLGRHGQHGGGNWSLSGTAAEVVDGASAAVLLVPLSAQPPTEFATLRRILIPLDCSQRAESALAPAVRLASACSAELLLIHAIPPVEITGNTPPSAEDCELVERLKRRNRAAGEHYLERIRVRLAGTTGRVRTLVVDEPVLETLLELPPRLEVDLVLMAAHGATGSTTWPYGRVAGHVIRHCTRPLLIMQDLSPGQIEHCLGHAAHKTDAPRLGHVHFELPP